MRQYKRAKVVQCRPTLIKFSNQSFYLIFLTPMPMVNITYPTGLATILKIFEWIKIENLKQIDRGIEKKLKLSKIEVVKWLKAWNSMAEILFCFAVWKHFFRCQLPLCCTLSDLITLFGNAGHDIRRLNSRNVHTSKFIMISCTKIILIT